MFQNVPALWQKSQNHHASQDLRRTNKQWSPYVCPYETHSHQAINGGEGERATIETDEEEEDL